MSLRGLKWKYINEGNLHIVIQVLATNYVLRFIKEHEKPVQLSHIHDFTSFVNLVMIPLTLNDAKNLQEVVEFPAEDLEELSMLLLEHRPKNRIYKSKLSKYAIKTTNLTLLSPKREINYCIEIKPKEGFISTTLKSYSRCYFCLKQLLKLRKQEITETSQYCPLDLFSGDKRRMKHALYSLINNPQNNFKMFRNSNIIYGKKSCLKDFKTLLEEMTHFKNNIDLFFDFIIETLTHNPTKLSSITLETSNCYLPIERSEQCIEQNYLSGDSFLSNLYSLQKLSENINFDETVSEEFDYVSNILALIQKKNLNLTTETDKKVFFESADPKHLALISAIAKDCSVMISFSFDDIEEFTHILVEGQKVPFRVAVTDLEPKSATTLDKRDVTEKKIKDIYQKHILSESNPAPHRNES